MQAVESISETWSRNSLDCIKLGELSLNIFEREEDSGTLSSSSDVCVVTSLSSLQDLDVPFKLGSVIRTTNVNQENPSSLQPFLLVMLLIL